MLSHHLLMEALPLTEVILEGWGERYTGKVRDIYVQQDQRILITTDRVSAFDRVLGAIPYKGQVLNQLSEWWFQQTSDIVDNHMLDVPDPNAMIVRNAETLPIEVIVRGYITGVTKTSLWTLYERGDRKPYGIALPDGLRKNDPLPHPVITPTTKATAGSHDEQISSDEILSQGLVSAALWRQIEEVSLALFALGQNAALKGGLILVDTKYEFGILDGKLLLIDEIHTPDSSRYWEANSYDHERNPLNFDKEYLREWFIAQGFKGEGNIPTMPTEFTARVAGRYIAAYERLTSQEFVPGIQPAASRIKHNLEKYRNQQSR